jgi:hypothetical protein
MAGPDAKAEARPFPSHAGQAMTAIPGRRGEQRARPGEAQRADRPQAGNPAEPDYDGEETPMRALILYYVVQAQAAEQHRQAQRDASARAASQARHPRTPRRVHRARTLPAVAARRMRTVLGGGSP